MKVAILVDKLIPGSAPKIVSEEALYLAKLGHKAEVLTMMLEEKSMQSHFFEDYISQIDVKYVSKLLPFLKLLDFRLPIFTFLSGYHFIVSPLTPFVIRPGEIDVAFAHTSTSWFGAYQLKRIRKIPFVFYHVDPISYIFTKVYRNKLPRFIFDRAANLVKRIEKILVENSTITITTSILHAEYLKSLTGRDADILYPGCNPLPNPPCKRKNYLLAIDRWDPGNMPHMLVEVLSKLRTKPKFVVAGFWYNKELYDSFLRLVKSKGLKEYVLVTGPVTEQTLSKLYAEARVFVHPTEESSISMPALEAAGHGCPIVMPAGTTEPFQHGVQGFFPPAGDLEAYADYLQQLLSDEELARRMGNEAWKVAIKNTWVHHAKKLEYILLKCLK